MHTDFPSQIILLYQRYGCKERTKTQICKLNDKKTSEKFNICMNKQKKKNVRIIVLVSMSTLTKRLEKKLDGNYTRILRAILNKSWHQHPTRRQLYGHLPPITKTIQAKRTRHAGHCWRSKD